MLIVNTPKVPNKAITEIHVISRGSPVRAQNFGSDIFAGLKNIVGGEISEYTNLQADSREQALQRMGANTSQCSYYHLYGDASLI